MAEYLNVSMSPGREGRRHWYVCGPDRGLVTAAFHELRELLAPLAGQIVWMNGPTADEAQLRDLLLHMPMYPTELPPLVVLDNAQEVDLSWLATSKPSHLTGMLLAVGTEHKAAEASARYSHFFKRPAVARLVLCRRSDDRKLAAWVEQRLGCSHASAVELVDRAAGNTTWLAGAIQRLDSVHVGQALHPEHVATVTGERPPGDLIDALLHSNKAAALRAIPERAEAASVLAEVEEVVLDGALVYEAQKSVGWATRLLSERTGIHASMIGRLRSHISLFDRISTERRLAILSRASNRAAQGDRKAWLSIIAAW